MENEKIENIYEKLLNWDSDVDSYAPLTNLQKESITELFEFAEQRPFPKLSINNNLPVNLQNINNENMNSFVGNPVENANQFLSCCSKIEGNIIEDHNILFMVYKEAIFSHKSQCVNLLNDITASLESLDTLNKKYIFVSNKTNALHEACEHLLAEQTKLVNSAESISEKLCYFNELEILSQKLNSPTLSVASEIFLPLLARLDECIAYLLANEQFKETNIYLARFRHLQNTALGLIRSYVVKRFEKITKQVMQKENMSSTENVFTLYYAKFRSCAPKFRTLIKQVEDRSTNNIDYLPLLLDLYDCYFHQREILFEPCVSSAINTLALNHKMDYCTLVRSGCAFLLHICRDEKELFHQFFSQNPKQLDDFLEKLCFYLYDSLRPTIIHINHLETLTELCSILKVEMLEEKTHIQEFNAQELTAFETVVKQMLEDVQERLVYRTHVYVKTDILNYSPAPGDLAYPEKLEMMESIAESLAGDISRSSSEVSLLSSNSVFSSNMRETGPLGKDCHKGIEHGVEYSDTESISSYSLIESKNTGQPSELMKKYTYSSADLHGMWYPTVRRALVCLSKLHRCLDKTTFQGLSQELLICCIQSLKTAGFSIAEKKSDLDRQLFQIKHLLILREQIAPFEIDFAIKQTTLDFSNIKAAAFSLLQKRSQFLALNTNNAILEFLLEGTPHVTEHLIDSKKAIDKELKMICEEYINSLVQILIGGIFGFLDKVKVVDELQKNSKTEIFLISQPFATAETVSELVSNTIRLIKNKLPLLLQNMSLYLANPDTEYILFKPVKIRILSCFGQFLQIIQNNYNEEQQLIISCPSIEQVSIILSSSIQK